MEDISLPPIEDDIIIYNPIHDDTGIAPPPLDGVGSHNYKQGSSSGGIRFYTADFSHRVHVFCAPLTTLGRVAYIPVVVRSSSPSTQVSYQPWEIQPYCYPNPILGNKFYPASLLDVKSASHPGLRVWHRYFATPQSNDSPLSKSSIPCGVITNQKTLDINFHQIGVRATFH